MGGHDRLFKVRPIIYLIILHFSAVYVSRLNEMTITFKERSTLKVYNLKQPDKYGYKAFTSLTKFG